MPSYDFQSLAPQDFEALVRDLLQAQLGIHIESFGPGKDGGVDLRFATGDGSVIVQAKRYSDTSRYSFAPNILSDKAKVAALKPARYMVATSLNLSPDQKSSLVSDLAPLPITTADVLCRSDLNNLLGQYPEVEKRHFKLWLHSTAILARIISNATYNKSHGELEQLRRRVKLFVDSDATPHAQKILADHRCLIISGSPGVGKTTLARILALIHLSQDWQLMVVDSFDEALEVFDEKEKQLFMFDDFLGRTRLTPQYLNSVDQPFVRFLDRVKFSKNTRFIMTTREYIFAQAKIASDRIDSPDVLVTKIVLDVGSYTRSVKAQILFNHIVFSDLNESQKGVFAANRLYRKIVDHKNYNPRLIETITNKNFVDHIAETGLAETLIATMDKPYLIWEKAYNNHLSNGARCLLSALFFGDGGKSLKDLQYKFLALHPLLYPHDHPADIRLFINSLREVDGSFVAFNQFDLFDSIWETVDFANPSVSDFLEHELARSDAALAVLGGFLFASQAIAAWEFFERHPETQPQPAALSKLLADASMRFVELPLGAVGSDGKSDFRDATLLNRLRAVLDWLPRSDPTIISSAAMALALRIREESAEDIAQTLAFIDHSSAISGAEGFMGDIVRTLEGSLVDKLQNDAGSLSFEDIQRLDSRYGSGEIIDSIEEALREIVSDLEGEMDNISTIEELDSFVELVIPLLNQYGVPTEELDIAVEERRDAIEASIAKDDYDDYEPSRPGTAAYPGSDMEIDSLFSTILNQA